MQGDDRNRERADRNAKGRSKWPIADGRRASVINYVRTLGRAYSGAVSAAEVGGRAKCVALTGGLREDNNL
jgi:hypothetical protein